MCVKDEENRNLNFAVTCLRIDKEIDFILKIYFIFIIESKSIIHVTIRSLIIL